MTYGKSLGIAIAMVSTIAALSAASASATQLCANSGTGPACASHGREYSGTVFATSTNASYHNSITNASCSDATVSISANTSTGNPLQGTVTGKAWSNCQTVNGTACTFTPKNLPYEISLSSTTLTIKDAVGVGDKLECGFLINCEFTSPEIKLAVKNGSPSTFNASGAVMNRSGGICPATAEFFATYVVTAPSDLTIL
jgi:hypothetical protein